MCKEISLLAVALALSASGAWALESSGSESVPAKGALTAIGQVNVAHFNRRTMCSGVLVAPNVVLTAAECAVDPTTRAPVDVRKIHFVAGVEQDRYAAHAKVDCVRFADGYEYLGPERHLPGIRQHVPGNALANSAALLILDRELTIAPIPLARGRAALEQGETYLVAGYGAQQRYRLALRNCRFVKSDAGSAFWTGSCTEPGASHGAPILATRGNALEVVGMTPASFDAWSPLGISLNGLSRAVARCE